MKSRIASIGDAMMDRLAANAAALTDAQRARLAAHLDCPPLSEQLRDALRGSPLTRYRVSKLTGISEQSLCRFVGGTGGISLEYADKLACVLGLRLVAARGTASKAGKKGE